MPPTANRGSKFRHRAFSAQSIRRFSANLFEKPSRKIRFDLSKIHGIWTPLMDNVLLVSAIVNIPSHNQGKSNPHVKSSKTCCMLSHILIGARIILRVLWDSKPTNLQVVICWEDYLGMTMKSLRIRLFTNGVELKASCVHNDTSWQDPENSFRNLIQNHSDFG